MQPLMKLLGASLREASDGRATIELPASQKITQQHGFAHAGAVAAIADSACGYSVMSLLPDDRGVLTVEYKISLLKPARGERFTAEARVLRSGRRISFVEAEVLAHTDEASTLIAKLSATIVSIEERQPAEG